MDVDRAVEDDTLLLFPDECVVAGLELHVVRGRRRRNDENVAGDRECTGRARQQGESRGSQ